MNDILENEGSMKNNKSFEDIDCNYATSKLYLRYIAAIVSIITVLLTFGQVIIQHSYHTKEIEIENTKIIIEQEKTKQLNIATQVELIDFVLDNYDSFFSVDTMKTYRVSSIMRAAFPNKQTELFFETIRQYAPPANSRVVKHIIENHDIPPKEKKFLRIKLRGNDESILIEGREVRIGDQKGVTDKKGYLKLEYNEKRMKIGSEISIYVDSEVYNYPFEDEIINLKIYK